MWVRLVGTASRPPREFMRETIKLHQHHQQSLARNLHFFHLPTSPSATSSVALSAPRSRRVPVVSPSSILLWPWPVAVTPAHFPRPRAAFFLSHILVRTTTILASTDARSTRHSEHHLGLDSSTTAYLQYFTRLCARFPLVRVLRTASPPDLTLHRNGSAHTHRFHTPQQTGSPSSPIGRRHLRSAEPLRSVSDPS